MIMTKKTATDPFAEINLPSPGDIRKWLKERNIKATFLSVEFDPALLGWAQREPHGLVVGVYDVTVCWSIARNLGWSKLRAADLFETRYDKFKSESDPVYLYYQPIIGS